MNSASQYDVVIIGAGMSGLAAGIRLAHFGKKVCIFERHNAVGGLNGFYAIAGRKFDVGLHAMTNYVAPGVKGTPLTKLLRQLRIDRDEFALCEQKRSRVAFGPQGELSLEFTNDFSVLEAQLAAKFPRQIDGFRALVARLRSLDDTALDAEPTSARAEVRRFITDPVLEDMLFCPLMYYGSAVERDMELGQFAIMFKAVFVEGFARPYEGVRLILRVLLDKYRAAGGERRMKCGVQRILVRDGRAIGVVLDSGEEILAHEVISSIGADETEALIVGPVGARPSDLQATTDGTAPASAAELPRLSYVETMTVLNTQPEALGWGDDTIVFFNDSMRFEYARPSEAVDVRSGVVCIPNNFQFGAGRVLPEGMLRVTCLANFARWAHLPEADYRAAKARWFTAVQNSGRRFLPAVDDATLATATVATDMFTPRTVARFTGHIAGAIYGSPHKRRQGRTSLPNVYLCGTDQGFLGIVGAMLSGISMANFHILAAAGKEPR
ncbi:NAD(P)/FAD-dependent oxidoreductase [Opitutus sp. ER46]|uniref:phytoene desaturase family protein n=1 Tax=Opitutus sp. ER46 TaxID=2161864 RepID=UPI000D2FB72E|nr:NAD(P)/FAD-dependent oxidoreductase [Opitutus sp. ER46]PTX99123.1 phytoene dehydrogenase [Opitutus sp. ER46]